MILVFRSTSPAEIGSGSPTGVRHLSGWGLSGGLVFQHFGADDNRFGVVGLVPSELPDVRLVCHRGKVLPGLNFLSAVWQ